MVSFILEETGFPWLALWQLAWHLDPRSWRSTDFKSTCRLFILGSFNAVLYVLVTQSCLILSSSMDWSSPGSSVHGILQARILEWTAIPFSRGSSQSRDQTWVSCIAVKFFTAWATRACCVRQYNIWMCVYIYIYINTHIYTLFRWGTRLWQFIGEWDRCGFCLSGVYSSVGLVKWLVKEKINAAGGKIITQLTEVKFMTYLFKWNSYATQQSYHISPS